MEFISSKRERVRRRVTATGMAGLLCVAACTSAQSGEAHNANPQPSPGAVTVENCQPGVKTSDGLYCEIQQFGATVFLNYENASGPAASLAIGQKVMVACLIPKATIASAHGGWYRLPLDGLPDVIPTERRDGYAVGNTFENGEQVGVPSVREVDPRVPICPTE